MNMGKRLIEISSSRGFIKNTLTISGTLLPV